MHGGKAATKAEKIRMSKLHRSGCIACHKNGFHTGMIEEVHHLLECGRRRGHAFTICLFAWHHRGILPGGLSRAEATAKYGPALCEGTRLFKNSFGDDNSLLAIQNELLETIK